MSTRTITTPDGTTTLRTARSSRFVLCTTGARTVCTACRKDVFPTRHGGYAHSVDTGKCTAYAATTDTVRVIVIVKGSDNLATLAAAKRTLRNKGDLRPMFVTDLTDGQLVTL